MATTLEQRIANAASGKSKLNFDPISSDNVILHVPLSSIDADETQPRKDFGDLEGLKASIKEHGVISPVILSPNGNRQYRIIAGERRYRASLELGVESIPAVIRTVEVQNRLELQIIENLHRKDLNPIEEAKSYQRLMGEFNLTQADVAEKIGKSKSSINELLRLLALPAQEINELCTADSVPKSVLIEIARHRDPAKRNTLLKRAKAGQLTVKEARNSKNGRQNHASAPKSKSHRFSVNHGEVIIKLRKSCPTINDMKWALREALEQLGEKED